MSTPGIHVIPLDDRWGSRLRMAVRPRRGEADASTAAAWERLRHTNPNLHAGPIFCVDDIDVAGARMVCSRRTYRDYATQWDAAAGDRGVRLLGVKGLLGDSHGRLFLGRRGPGVWCYPKLWEIAPGGGVPPTPAATQPELTVTHLAETLVAEAREELGLHLSAAALSPVMLIRDESARSIDVVLRADVPAAVVAAMNWEYLDLRCMTPAEARSLGDELSPPTRAALALF